MTIDRTDWEILYWLQNNARMQWKDIGDKVHLTGQAVAARIRKLEDLGIIEGYTVKLNQEKMGNPITALITVFMKTTDHHSFQLFLLSQTSVIRAHRISGEGCYWLETNVSGQEELNKLLDEILQYGNYRLNLSIGSIK